MRLKIRHMCNGTIFRNGKDEFIKLQDVLPSGIYATHQSLGREYNAVYLDDGCIATLPLWLECEVIKHGTTGPSVEERQKMFPED